MLKDDHASNEPFTGHLHLHNDYFPNRMAKIGIKKIIIHLY